jgi:DnaJ-like protein/PilZ domain-containing protein
MLQTADERRRQPRVTQPHSQPVQLSCLEREGEPRTLTALLLDVSAGGFGVETEQPLTTGCLVTIAGEMISRGSRVQIEGHTRVAYCTPQPGGTTYRVGLRLEQSGSKTASHTETERGRPPAPQPESNFSDNYELLQVSPNADPDTIHRVYRILAQRYHPDNHETGNEEMFKQLTVAYRMLSDPEQRAAYDLQHRATRRLQWKIFDQPNAAEGVEGERHKRQGILSLLYTKRVNQPHQPEVTLLEFEELLGCPREHLECSIWYLREKGLLRRADNGRHSITAQGFDEAEASGLFRPPQQDRLLTTADPRDPVQQTATVIEKVLTPA